MASASESFASSASPRAHRRCVITLGVTGGSPPGSEPVARDFGDTIQRLATSLANVGFADDVLYWRDEYPPGSPTHELSPWGFKPFCFQSAMEAGYESILWLDATIRAVRPVESLFQSIERDGYVIFAEDHSVGTFCKDEALVPLGISRESSFRLRCCWAAALGFSLRDERCREFLRRWRELAVDGVTFPGPRWSGVRGFPRTASTDPRVKGHRHDQTAASVVAAQCQMTRWFSKRIFHQYFSSDRRAVPTFDAGTVPMAPRTSLVAERAPDAAAKLRVLFFSRGRGRGHIVPDLAIIGEMAQIAPRMAVEVASYGTGAATCRKAGVPVYDLNLPDTSTFLSVLQEADALVKALSPDIVVAHEEFAALTAARLARIPAILVTDWIPSDHQVLMDAVGSSNAIMVLGEEGAIPLPSWLDRPVVHAGPVVRRMQYQREDRMSARAELGIPKESFVTTVLPGAWATEARFPISDLVLEAFRTLARPKHLFWVNAADQAQFAERVARAVDLVALPDCDPIDRLMVASDVIVTKANRGTIFDAASLGIPTISISRGLNPVDDRLIALIKSNRSFRAEALTPVELGSHLEALAMMPPETRATPLNLHREGGRRAAEILAVEIRKLAATFVHVQPPAES